MIEERFMQRVADAVGAVPQQVTAAIDLLDAGATVPFVARYRKDVTGNLDEGKLDIIAAWNKRLAVLTTRRRAILENIAKQGKLTDELREKIEAADDKIMLEDLYAPYKTKRRTKATAAEEHGLGPLADFLLQQLPGLQVIEEFATAFVKPERSISSVEEAIEGARYILAERFTLDAEVRRVIRERMLTAGHLTARSTKNAEGRKTKFEAYYDFAEPLNKIPSHRVLAILRGVKEGFLRVDIAIDDEQVFTELLAGCVKEAGSPFEPYIRLALQEAYARHLRPAIENEVISLVRERADDDAIRVFRENAESLLLAPPAGPIKVIGVAPAPKNGSILAVVDETGAFVESQTIFAASAAKGPGAPAQKTKATDAPAKPAPDQAPAQETATQAVPQQPGNDAPAERAVADVPDGGASKDTASTGEQAHASPPAQTPGTPENDAPDPEKTVADLIEKHSAYAFAIANGKGSRETAAFVNGVLRKIAVKRAFAVLTNDAGAATYSTSKLARDELPDLDAATRVAVFIARRLQDPLTELVKVEPRTIGVGQYQHDVNQKRLREGLSKTIASCVNRVGVDLNTASASSLRYISGLRSEAVQKIIETREKLGGFTSRVHLLEVEGVGMKAFEQCAGFLRVRGGENPLDATAIHPEAYPLVQHIAEAAGVPVAELIGNREALAKVNFTDFENEDAGPLTLAGIRSELYNPARDPRRKFRVPRFLEGIRSVRDLEEGMEMEGVVTNVTDFGAFVDIGLSQDGLVHLSELSRRFVQDPRVIVKVGDIVRVKVIKVEKELTRISLSMKAVTPRPRKGKADHAQKPPGKDRGLRDEPRAREATRAESPRRLTRDRPASARGAQPGDGPRRRQKDAPEPRGREARRETRGAKRARQVTTPRGGPRERAPRQKAASAPFNTGFAEQLAQLKDKLGS